MHSDKFTKGSRGEFRGDFTRDTFDPLRHYSRVLMQQGRVQLDADWNEQVSIATHYLRHLAVDVMGPHAAPRNTDGKPGDGFKIIANGTSFDISAGDYYVNGILCQNDTLLAYNAQHDYPVPNAQLENSASYVVYLDVWERHLSYVEDDYMREKALNGPDTASRAGIVWQVKLKNHNEFQSEANANVDPAKFKENYGSFLKALTSAGELKPGSGLLKARARKAPADNTNPCLTAPEARYRGAENQLYRLEMHSNSGAEGGPTFKWSRENGSVIFPILDVGGKIITLENLGRDNRCGLKPNDWVEIADDDYILGSQTSALLQISAIDSENLQVTLQQLPASTVGTDPGKHPYLRRWDQKSGGPNGVPVTEGNQEQDWIALEDGVEVQFPAPDEGGESHVYQAGDYWLIPVRTATGDVEWPGPVDVPEAVHAQGVEHHYAPLWNLSLDANGAVSTPADADLRRKIDKLWK